MNGWNNHQLANRCRSKIIVWNLTFWLLVECVFHYYIKDSVYDILFHFQQGQDQEAIIDIKLEKEEEQNTFGIYRYRMGSVTISVVRVWGLGLGVNGS